MSVEGTGIAAGVAASTHTAQQVSRQRDKTRTDEKAQFRQTLDRVETQARAARTEDSDQELPDRQPPGYEQAYGKGKSSDQPDDPPVNTEAPDAPPPADQTPYRHIDIRA